MPARLLQSLSVAERGFSFQDRHSLAIGTSREDNLCNEMFQDGAIVCHSSSTLYMMSYITFYKHYVTIFATAGNENGIGRSPDHFSLCGKNGLGTQLRVMQAAILSGKISGIEHGQKKNLSLSCNLRRDQPELSRYANYLTVNNNILLLLPITELY